MEFWKKYCSSLSALLLLGIAFEVEVRPDFALSSKTCPMTFCGGGFNENESVYKFHTVSLRFPFSTTLLIPYCQYLAFGILIEVIVHKESALFYLVWK